MSTELLKQAHSAVKREDWPQAWGILNSVLNSEPDRSEALYLMGTTLRALGNIGLAYQALRRALAGEQRQINLWMTYAATLHDLNRWDEARDALLVAHKMMPADPMPIANIGATFVQQGKWRDALEWCDKAIKLDSECHVARISANFANLSLGRWTQAWEDASYLYGRHLQVRVYNPPEHEEPQWDGRKGEVVAVQADQGVGDILMFAQCLPQLAADCKEVILECAPRLVSLMSRNFPQITVVGTLKDDKQHWASDRIGTPGQVQAHVHISYLGKWYRRLDASFPRKAYLTAHEGKVAEWKEWLAKYPKPWVGISWKGGIQATQTHLRSIDLADLAPVLESGGTMIDLSYLDSSLEVARWNIEHESQVIVPPINTDDFENTVALVAALDEVVTVTTTVAHVCGALDRTAHVLVPSVPQWRYAYRVQDGMIWYPDGSVHLYRQLPGEITWENAINRLARDLKPRLVA